MSQSHPARVFDFYLLEERVLLSGEDASGSEIDASPADLAVLESLSELAGADGTAVNEHPIESFRQSTQDAEEAFSESSRFESAIRLEVVFIDGAVDNSGDLIHGIRDSAPDETQWVVVELSSDEDGIEQISQTRRTLQGIDAIHLVSHGDGDGIQLGNSRLDNGSIQGYAGDIAHWASSLDRGADLLIYGCDLASTENGQTLVGSLAALCDCDVAASEDVTGHQSLGGDWILEYQVGDVETEVAFVLEVQASWTGTLDITSNLIAHYEFDEGSGTDLVDSVASTIDGNLQSGADFSVGAVGASDLEFAMDSGSNALAVFPDTNKIDLGTGDFSIGFWVYVPAGGTNSSILSDHGLGNGYEFNLSSSGEIEWNLNGSLASTTLRSATLQSDAWHHVTGIRNGTDLGLFVDGTMVDSSSTVVGSLDNADALILGAASTSTLDFDGRIDDLRYYERSLLAADVAELVNTSGAPTELAIVQSSEGVISINQSGNDAYLVSSSGLANDLDALTLEVTFQATPASAETVFFSYNTAAGDELSIQTNSPTNALELDLTNNTVINSTAIDYTAALLDGNQHTLSVTWENVTGSWAIYIDSVLIDQDTGVNVGEVVRSGGTFVLGQEQDSPGGGFDSNQIFSGEIFDVRLFDDVRTATEIADNVGAEIDHDTENLIANWKFDQRTANGAVYDAVGGLHLTQAHVTGAGFVPGEISLTLSVDERAPNGTVVGVVQGVDFERTSQIKSLLDADPSLVYSEATGRFYKLVNTPTDWIGARIAAESSTLESVTGQLATIGSSIENSIIESLARGAGVDIWLGGTDATQEGQWRWRQDGSDGDLFWIGDENGDNPSGTYHRFAVTDPDNAGNEDGLLMSNVDGQWRDADLSNNHAFVVEWDADDVVDVTQPLFYSIVSQPVFGAFAIDSGTGQISVNRSDAIDFETLSTHAIEIEVRDAGDNTLRQSVTIEIENQNETPANIFPGPQTTNEDVPLIFRDADSNAIQINDDAAENLTVQLSVTSGSLTLSQVDFLTFESGVNGDAQFVITGAIADINAALEGMTYSTPADFNGSDTLTITTTDAVTYRFNVDPTALGRYEFNPSALQSDSSAASADGSLIGNASSATDLLRGDVLSLDGDGDQVHFAHLFGSQQDLTLSAWVNLNNADAGGSDLINIGNRVIVRLDDTTVGGNVVGTFYDGSSFRTTDSGVSIEGTGWHLITYTVDSATNTQTLFIDGVAAATTNFTQSISYAGASTSSIGGNPSFSLYDLNGQVDDARIFGRALSAAEVGDLFNAPVDAFDSDTVDITVVPVNDAPLAVDELLDGSNDYETDRDVALSVGSALGVLANDSDPDGDGLSAALLTGPANASSFTLNPDGSFDYTPTANFAGTDSFTYTVSDGNGGSDVAVAYIRVIAVNRDPTLTIGSAPLSFSENDVDLFIDSSATVSDLDLVDFDGGQLSVTVSSVSATVDQLVIIDEGVGAGQVYVLGTDVRVGTQIVGVVAGGSGSADPLVVTFNSNADESDVEAISRRIAFRNLSDNPSESTRTVTMRLTDGDGGDSGDQSRVILVTAINDAPVASGPVSVTVLEEVATNVSGLSIADVDAQNALITTRLQANDGVLSVTLVGGAGISSGANGSSDLTLTGTVADINNTLSTLVYAGNVDVVGVSADTITMTVDDDGNSGTGGAFQDTALVQVDIDPVNDAPIVTVPSSPLLAMEQTPLNLHAAGFSVADVDAVGGAVTATLDVTQGSLTIGAGASGITIDSGNGTSSVQLSGSIAQINSLLSGASGGTIVYLNSSDDPTPSVTVTLTVNDQGNTGQDPGTSGDATSEEGTASQSILVTAINDEENLVVNNTLALNENDSATITPSELLTTDPDHSADAIVYRVDVPTARGTIEVSGVPIGIGGTFTQEDIDLGNVVYVHDGTPIAADSFDFTVDDGEGTSTSGTLNISITIVNDAPTILAPSTASTPEDTTLALSSAGIGAIDLFDEEGDTINVQLSANDGVLTLASTAGLTVIDGDGSDGTLEFSGNETSVDFALDGLTFDPNLGFNGAVTLGIVAGDGTSSSTLDVSITVDPVTTVFVWDGGGTTNDWSDALNWDLDRVPRADDVVVFDATSIKDSTVDAGFAGSVSQVQVNASYLGTITQAIDLVIVDSSTLSGGSWLTSGRDLDVGGDWTVDGSSLDVSNSNVYVRGDLNQTSSLSSMGSTWWIAGGSDQFLSANDQLGNLQINSAGTITLGGDLSYDGDFVYSSGIIQSAGNTISLVGGGNQTIQSGTLTFEAFRFNTSGDVTIVGQMDVDGLLSIDSLGSLNGGSILASSDVVGTDATWGGTATIVLDGTVNQTVSASGGEGSLSNLEINKASGTAFLTDQINLSGDITLTAGSVDASGLVLSLVSISSGTIDGSIGPVGQLHFDTLGTKTINSVLEVLGTTTVDSLNTLNGGILRVLGDISTRDLTYGGSTVMELSGSGNQVISTNGGTGVLHNVTINKSGGVVSASDDLTLTGAFRHVAGSADFSSILTQFQSSGLSLDAETMDFGDVSFTGFVSATITGDLNVDGDLLFDSAFVINGGMIRVTGDVHSSDTAVLGTSVLVFEGSGNQVITGDDLPNGDLIINKSSGSVLLGDDLVLNGSAQNVIVSSGELVFSGNQIVLNGAVQIDSGDLIGDASIVGDLVIQNGGRVILDVNSLVPGDHEQVDVNGNVSFGSGAVLQLDISGIATGGHLDDLLTYTNRSGSWSSIVLVGDSVGFTPFETFDDLGGRAGVFLNTGPTGSLADVTVSEDSADTVIDLAANLTDQEHSAAELVYSIVSNTNPGLFSSVNVDNGTNLLTLDYAPEQSGTANITVRTTDPFGMSFDQSFTVTVNSFDDIPLVSSAGFTVDEGNSFTLSATQLQASDADNLPNELRYTVTTSPGSGSITVNGVASSTFTQADVDAGSVQYRHDGSEGTSDSFSFTLTDGNSVLGPFALAISINAVNDNAPVIGSDGGGSSASISLAENTTAVTTVVATDADLPAVSLTYTITGGADATLFDLQLSSGVLTFLSAPDAEVALDSDGNNIYEVTVTVSDGALTDSQTIQVSVSDVNEFATVGVFDFDAGADQINENALLGSTVGITAGADDSDATLNTITYTLVDDDSCRFAIDPVSGVVRTASDIDFESGGGSRNLIVRATSADGSFVDQTFVVTVTDVAEAPVALDDDLSVIAGETLSTTAPGILANDFDSDGDSLIAVLVSSTSDGTLTIQADGSIIYVPDAGFVGVDVFQYQVNDGSLLSTMAEVRINVTIGGVLPPPGGGGSGTGSGSGTGGNSGSGGSGDDGGNQDGGLDDGGGSGNSSDSNSGDGNDSGGSSDDVGETTDDSGDSQSEESSSSNAESQGQATLVSALPPREQASGDAEAAESLPGELEDSLPGLGGSQPGFVHAVYRSVFRATITEGVSLASGISDIGQLEQMIRMDMQQAIVWDLWDKEEALLEESPIEFLVGSAGAAAGLFSIGYVMWALRGGAFVTVMASSMPAWRIVDPAAILTAYRGSRFGADGLEDMMG